MNPRVAHKVNHLPIKYGRDGRPRLRNPDGGWYEDFSQPKGSVDGILIRRGMSTVIMAVCYDRPNADEPAKPYIIASCDMQLSSGFTSIENFGFAKIQKSGLWQTWLLGFAGDPSHFVPIREHFAKLMNALEWKYIEKGRALAKEGDKVPQPPAKEVALAFEDAYTTYRDEIIRKRFLAPLGIADKKQLISASRNCEQIGTVIGEISQFDLGML